LFFCNNYSMVILINCILFGEGSSNLFIEASDAKYIVAYDSSR
jgi:hypothetical protein